MVPIDGSMTCARWERGAVGANRWIDDLRAMGAEKARESQIHGAHRPIDGSHGSRVAQTSGRAHVTKSIDLSMAARRRGREPRSAASQGRLRAQRASAAAQTKPARLLHDGPVGVGRSEGMSRTGPRSGGRPPGLIWSAGGRLAGRSGFSRSGRGSSLGLLGQEVVEREGQRAVADGVAQVAPDSDRAGAADVAVVRLGLPGGRLGADASQTRS